MRKSLVCSIPAPPHLGTAPTGRLSKEAMETASAETPNDVLCRAEALRQNAANAPFSAEQTADALRRVMELWQARLKSGWTPPEQGAFPWEMVRVSLAALAAGPMPSAFTSGTGGLVALLCAGNTPLLAWPALCAGLLAGASVYVKMSRHETLWPRLFVQSLYEANAPELAQRVCLDLWPGTDAKTAALAQIADTVIAYGSDASMASVREATPPQTPFFGFGHALSVGVWTKAIAQTGEAEIKMAAHGFARDVMMYNQGGCLSPHTLFVEAGEAEAQSAVPAICAALSKEMRRAADELHAPKITDAAVARALREARDMAHFDGYSVWASETNPHHGVVIGLPFEREMPPPVGHGVVFVVPVSDLTHLCERFGAARGKISSVGVAGSLPNIVEAALRENGVSRICKAGMMQAPPLAWPNGNTDLFSALPDALC